MPRWKQQIGGLVIALIGAGFTAWGWYTALYRGYFYSKGSMFFPAVFVLGLGMTIFRVVEAQITRAEQLITSLLSKIGQPQSDTSEGKG